MYTQDIIVWLKIVKARQFYPGKLVCVKRDGCLVMKSSMGLEVTFELFCCWFLSCYHSRYMFSVSEVKLYVLSFACVQVF